MCSRPSTESTPYLLDCFSDHRLGTVLLHDSLLFPKSKPGLVSAPCVSQPSVPSPSRTVDVILEYTRRDAAVRVHPQGSSIAGSAKSGRLTHTGTSTYRQVIGQIGRATPAHCCTVRRLQKTFPYYSFCFLAFPERPSRCIVCRVYKRFTASGHNHSVILQF